MNVGDRVKVAPHLDCYMRGDRGGKIVAVGTRWVHVRMFASRKVRKFSASSLKVDK